jgi:hypothetical protein
VTDTQTRLDAIRDLAGRLHAPATGGNTRPLRTEAADTLLVLVAELERVTAANAELRSEPGDSTRAWTDLCTAMTRLAGAWLEVEGALAAYGVARGGEKVWGPERMRHDPERKR